MIIYKKLIYSQKYPDFFYKVLIISIYSTHICCCDHGLYFERNLTCSSLKIGQIIFETFQNREEKNLSLNLKVIKMKCVDFMVKNLGKNTASLYLIKIGNTCNNKNDIFNYIINETNLIKDILQEKQKNDYDFAHCIDNLEKFLSSSNSPEFNCDILLLISIPKKQIEIRIYRDLLINLNNNIKDDNTEKLEKYIYNSDIFKNILETLNQDIWLGEYEGIWQVLLNSQNKNIIKIFGKNKYNVTEIFNLQVDNLIEKYLIEMRLTAVIRIMTLFLKIGEKIKNEFVGDNYYANEFKKIYLKISELSNIKNEEDYKEFENYFK